LREISGTGLWISLPIGSNIVARSNQRSCPLQELKYGSTSLSNHACKQVCSMHIKALIVCSLLCQALHNVGEMKSTPFHASLQELNGQEM